MPNVRTVVKKLKLFIFYFNFNIKQKMMLIAIIVLCWTQPSGSDVRCDFYAGYSLLYHKSELFKKIFLTANL